MADQSKADAGPFRARPYLDLMLVQYELNFVARDRARLTGRIVFISLLVVSSFLSRSTSLIQLAMLLYAVVLFGVIWLFEDRRRGRALGLLEEILVKDASIGRYADEFSHRYIRGRVEISATFSDFVLRTEPLIWLTLASAFILAQVFLLRRVAQ